MRNQYKIRGY